METSKDLKSTRWAFTAYEGQWSLFAAMHPLVAEWGWQTETCPKTQRLHYQGYLRTHRQVRFSQITKAFPGVHFEVSENWNALIEYCKKPDTAVEGTQVHQIVQKIPLTMAQALIKVAEYRDRDADFSNCESVKDFKDAYAHEFEVSVSKILREDENLIGLYSQPNYERAYVKFRSVWVEKVTEKTDRQTDTAEEKAPAGRVQLATRPRTTIVRQEEEEEVDEEWCGAFDRS